MVGRRTGVGPGLLAALIVVVAGMGTSPEVAAQDIKAVTALSEQTATGFAFPESVASLPRAALSTSPRASGSTATDCGSRISTWSGYSISRPVEAPFDDYPRPR
jgi:hypothetical protein